MQLLNFCVCVGLSPRITFVNSTSSNTIEITTETRKVSLYFEVFTNPPLISTPQLTVNNSDQLSSKWKVVYRSPNMDHITDFAGLTHFFIEMATDGFTQKDCGDYTLTVNNTCSLSKKTVTIKGKQIDDEIVCIK